jgi:hypothetical protein
VSGSAGGGDRDGDAGRAEHSTLQVVGRILEVGAVPDGLATWLADELTSFWPSTQWSLGPPLPSSPDWGSGPVDVDRILDAVIELAVDRSETQPGDGSVRWTLALSGIDAVAPGRGEVFGRATVGGGFALVAVRPLQRGTSLSGEGLALLRTRVLKESLHELGHAADRGHCSNVRCLMHPVRDLPGVDARPFRFCSRCDPFPDTSSTR